MCERIYKVLCRKQTQNLVIVAHYDRVVVQHHLSQDHQNDTFFEVVYGYPLPSILSYVPNTSSNVAVEKLLCTQEQIINILKETLTEAHNHMKNPSYETQPQARPQILQPFPNRQNNQSCRLPFEFSRDLKNSPHLPYLMSQEENWLSNPTLSYLATHEPDG